MSHPIDVSHGIRKDLRQADAVRHFISNFTPAVLERDAISTTNRRTRLCRAQLEGFDEPLMLKTYWVDPELSLWRSLGPRLASMSRVLARESFEGALALESAGVPTLRAIAWWTHRAMGQHRATHLLYERVSANETLRSYRSKVSAPGAEEDRDFMRLLARTARLVRTLHDQGLRHGSLELGNVLIAFKPGGDDPEQAQLTLIDTDAVTRTRLRLPVLKGFLDLRDLARLNVGAAGRAFVLHAYLDQEPGVCRRLGIEFWRLMQFRPRKWLRRYRRSRKQPIHQRGTSSGS